MYVMDSADSKNEVSPSGKDLNVAAPADASDLLAELNREDNQPGGSVRAILLQPLSNVNVWAWPTGF